MSNHYINGHRVGVYPVGVLDGWQSRKSLADFLIRVFRFLRRYIGWGSWRAVKNTFNGYLAEPCPWPAGLRRCGSGWTKRRALADLERRMRKVSRA